MLYFVFLKSKDKQTKMKYLYLLYVLPLMMVTTVTAQDGSFVRRFEQIEKKIVAPRVTTNTNFKSVYYFPLGAIANTTNKGIPVGLNIKLTTHLIFIPTNIANNSIVLPKPNMEDNFLKVVSAMKQEEPSIVILVSSQGAFNPVMQSLESTMQFINSVIVFLRKYNLDGIDLDWEFPTASQYRNFSRVFTEFRKAFEEEATKTKKPRLLLTAAVLTGEVTAKSIYDFANMSKAIDFVNMMGYDFNGPWGKISHTGYNSPLPGLAAGANFWASHIGKDKVVVGIPFYSHSFKLVFSWLHGLNALADGRGECENSGYVCTCQAIQKKNATVVFDGYNKVPYCYYGYNWITFENVDSITIKTNWILKNGFPGVMVWEMLADDLEGYCDGETKYPLMNAIQRAVDHHQK